VSFAFSTPFGVYNSAGPVWKENQSSLPENEVRSILYNRVDEEYFKTLQIPILRGRAFSPQDQPSSLRVAIVNETMAEQLWPGEDPIGHHFSFGSASAPAVEIVGVAKDGRYAEAMEDARAYFYLPLSQNYQSIRVLHVRAAVDPVILIATLQREIQNLE